MKYKRGSIVEVLVTDDVCYRSWRCAQIVSGNGHYYTVSYDVYPGFTDEEDVDYVSVKSIRPCPPLVNPSECWGPNDVVEVFHYLSWKMAIVSKSLGWDQFLVRLVGSSQEFEVIKSGLRVRQSWLNGEWVVIGKVPRDSKDANQSNQLKHTQDSISQSKQKDAKGSFKIKDPHFDAPQNNLMESRIISTNKRRSPSYSQVAQKEDRPLKKRFDRENINGASSVASSIGSCSIDSYKPYEIYHGSSPTEDNDSDAESICQLGCEEETDQSPTHEALAEEIHRLELHAYRCTMEALHASGPLNWEKETMGQSRRLVHLL